MIIDFHTHIYPDKIAPRAIENVLKNNEFKTPPTDGTFNGLIESEKEAGIDISVVLPVATRAGQFDSLNAFAKQVNSQTDKIISFAGIHPDDENIEQKLDFIKSQGFKGIKLHPDYQNTFVDDDKYFRIVSYAVEIGLIVVFHAGIDNGLPFVVHCPADRAARLIDRVYGGKTPDKISIVLAHMAGINEPDSLRKYIIGKPGFLDTAYILDKADPSLIVSLAREHG
ncbi:MAG: amidohydrolase family protein, partial [Acutalibacteraceae bacterium]